MIEVDVVTKQSDLETLVKEINAASWDAANDVCAYAVESLTNYLSRQDTVFVVAHDRQGTETTFVGMASARIEIKPYENQRWLYVDEVDVCVDQRKKGAGTAIMKKLLEIAKEADCEELWLGTELDNEPANALYQSLDPDEVEKFVGYNYELDD